MKGSKRASVFSLTITEAAISGIFLQTDVISAETHVKRKKLYSLFEVDMRTKVLMVNFHISEAVRFRFWI